MRRPSILTAVLVFLGSLCVQPLPAAPTNFFPIMGWNGVPNDPAALRKMKECGLTVAGFAAPEVAFEIPSSTPLTPFLNSITVLPSDRPMSGSLRPNSRTPNRSSRSISCIPRPGMNANVNMVYPPQGRTDAMQGGG